MPMLPALSDLTGFGQTVFAIAVLTLAGRAALAGRGGPGMQFVAGWSLLSLALVGWGVVTAASLRQPAAAFALVSFAGLLPRGTRRADLAEAGRMLAVALPLLAVMADVAPSQPDALYAIIPNAAYIADYGHFPTANGPAVHTDVPVAPYGQELVTFLGGLAGGGFQANGPSLVTVFLHLVAGLILARALAGGVPGWRHTALGLLLATLFNPAFVPRISLSGYGEAPLAVAFLAAVWLGARVLDEVAAGERRPRHALPLVLALAILINIKQQSIGVFAAFGGGALAAILSDPRLDRTAALRVLGAAMLPAIALYLAWRGYVASAFPAGELKPLPLSEWEWHLLPGILADMGRVVLRQPVYFLAAGTTVALAFRPPRALAPTTRRVLTIAATAFVLYCGFLLLTFVGHFRGEHSFFRYNMHLAMGEVLGLALAARDLWGTRLARAGRLAVPLMLVAPLAAAPLLRFDRDWPQPRLRFLAQQVAGEIGPADRLALFLPDDNATVAAQLDALLRYAAPRRPQVDAAPWSNAAPASFAAATAAGYTRALVSCINNNHITNVPQNSAAWLVLQQDGWKVEKVWTYPPAPRRKWWNWTGFIAGEPLCL